MAILMVRDFREQAGLTLEDLAGDIEISVSQLSRIETGKREARLVELQRIADRLHTKVGALIGEPTPIEVPIVSWVSAGLMHSQDPIRNVDVQRKVQISDLPPGDWMGLEVQGDSMDRIAPPGSIIVIDRKDIRPRDERFYVFGYDDDGGGTTFKRFRSGDPPRLQPFSTNPDHETIYPRNGLRVIGRVRRVITDL
ncbi:XRE family transcriptional regulator [Antarcticirhabdus aurantiaca]|uniref:LexA family transcriptional regulator n=1 Tax=Antarcticirhabdus aurantiaca TaxID=2606717 RepID=A0ACD4NKY4_9HYPH|nr:LexA family transcriptional regulator [Jeongeuplla avenae]